MIVLVCGGRNYNDKKGLFDALNLLNSLYKITGVVEGEANGADKLARSWAEQNNVECYKHPADWNKHGKAAGHIRNSEMLQNNPKPEYCVAFPGGVGTLNMIKQAAKAGLTIWKPYW